VENFSPLPGNVPAQLPPVLPPAPVAEEIPPLPKEVEKPPSVPEPPAPIAEVKPAPVPVAPPLPPPPVSVAEVKPVEAPASSPKLRPPVLPTAGRTPEAEKKISMLKRAEAPPAVVPTAAILAAATAARIAEVKKAEPPVPTKKGASASPAAPDKKTSSPLAGSASASSVPPVPEVAIQLPPTRAARAKKRKLISTIVFYVIAVFVVAPVLYLVAIHFSTETRVEGQVIPPSGALLTDEVWIVTGDIRGQAAGVAEDLAADRAPKLQQIQERQDHVQRAQADIAAREERIRLLQEQIQAAKDEIASIIKQARDGAQHVWDGPGAALQDEYKSRLNQFRDSIATRAKSLNLTYAPDNTYQSPEVWANAYRLALYQTPPGVDGTKEHEWIEAQLKAWRDYTKSVDDRQQKLREQAAQIQLSPTSRVADLNGKVDDLQHRVDSTLSEEEPLKTELQQAQTDLVESQTAEAGLDAKYYDQLNALPVPSILSRLPLDRHGRFSWRHLERERAFAEGERTHNYSLFARAIRTDGRQYWALFHLAVDENTIQPVLVPPDSFLSTKAILRPDLPPDEQQ